MSLDLETIGIAFDTSGLVNGQRALKDTEAAANKTADAADAAGKKGSKGLADFGSAADIAKRQTESLAGATDVLSKAIDLAAKAYAAFKVYEYIKDAALLNARYETLGISMTVVGKNAGYTASQMENAAVALQKTGISMIESRQQAMRLVQAHIDLTASTKLARIAQDAAVIGNMNSSEAFATMIHGIQTGQTEVLRTIGLNISMEQSYKSYAKELHKTAEQLTQNEKTQAILNAVIAAGADIAGVYTAAMDTAGKQLNSMKRYTEDLKTMQGEVFNEVLTVAVMGYTEHLKDANGEINELARNGELKAWGEDLAGIFVTVANAIDNALNGVKMIGTWIAHQSAGGEINKKFDKLLVTNSSEFPFKSTMEGTAERQAQIEKLREKELAAEQKFYEDSQVKMAEHADRFLRAYEDRQKAKLEKQAKSNAEAIAKEQDYYAKVLEVQKAYAGYSLKVQRDAQTQLAKAFFGDNHQYKDTQAEVKKIKEISIHEQAAHAAVMASVKAEKDLRADLEKDMQSFSRDQLARSKSLTKEIIDGINEQAKTYLAFNKSLDDHAERMADTNTLAQLEIDLLGVSAVERNTLIEQKKIELTLERQIREIRASNMSEGDKNLLIDKANSQALIDKSTAQLRAQQSEWTKFYGDIYNGLYDSLYRGFEAGKGFGKSFLDSIKNLFKTNVIKVMVQAVMGGAGGMVSSMASAISGGGGSSGSGIGIDSVFNIGSTLMKGFTAAGAALNTSLATGIGELGATMGSEFMLSVSSMMQGGAASGAAGTIAGGLTSAATAMPYVAAAVAAFQGMKAINGDYRLGGLSADMGALLGVLPRLFGRKAPELQQSELSGTVNASGFNATTRDVYKAEGGLFRSDKWSEVKTPMAGASELSAQYNAISAVAKSYADLLGLSTESLASFSKSFTFNLSKTGDAAKDAEANQKLINDLFVGITNDITNLLAPSISAFGKEGENVSQTFQRLAMSLTSVNAVMKAVGFAEFGKSLEGANAAQRLSDLSGGIEKLASGAQYFYENFLDEAEKIKPIADQVSATMARLGQSSVDTIPEFKLLVQGLDLTSEAQAKMYAELIAIAPQFKAVADSNAAEELRKLNEATKELEIVAQKAKAIADERKSLQDEYNQLTMTSTQLYDLYKNGLDDSNRSLADSIQAIKLKSTEEAAAAAKLAEEQTKANAIASERSSIQNEINQLTMTSAQLLDLQRNGLNEANRALFDFLQATKEKIAGDKQLADMQKSIDNERASLMSELNDLTMTNEQRLQLQRFAINEVNVGIYDQIVAIKEKTKADAEAAATAKVIADQRKSLQDEYNNLTMTESQLLDLRRSNYDAANRDLFDLIQAEKATRAKALEDQKAYNDSIAELQRQAQAIAAERSSLQDEYNQLTMTEIQLMELKRTTLNSSNQDLFDLIQAEKKRQAETAKADEYAKNAQSEWARSMQDAYDKQKGILGDIVSEFGSLLKSLQDFSRNLKTGDLSKASPEERYKLLGAEVAGLVPKVQLGDKQAIADFMKVGEEYLKASEVYNASSEQYFKDKDYIQKYIDEAAKYAQGQIDVAQLQLDAINGNVAATNAVNASIQQVLQVITAGSGGLSGGSSGSASSAMTALSGYGRDVIKDIENLGGKDALLSGALSGDPYGRRNLQKQLDRWNRMGLNSNDMDMILGRGWLDKFIEALGIPKGLFGDQINFMKYMSENMQQIPGFANGGNASGLVMVGEKGPELINLGSTSRVHSNRETNDLLSSKSDPETKELLREQNKRLGQILDQLKLGDGNNGNKLEAIKRGFGDIKRAADFAKSRVPTS
nr:hypothetical protein [uncultured Undibacterium sp.]